jgi:hypothetical protein
MHASFILNYNNQKLDILNEEEINYIIEHNDIDRGKIRDEYHSFRELYDFRKMYNAALFNEWWLAEKYQVHKSIRHNDGELCFGGGWFIVVALLPSGQISNHYKMEDWDLFDIPADDIARLPFDGHTPADVLERLKNICYGQI